MKDQWKNLRQQYILIYSSGPKLVFSHGIAFALCVLSLQGIKPEKKTNDAGKPVDDYWPAAKRVGLVESAINRWLVKKSSEVSRHVFLKYLSLGYFECYSTNQNPKFCMFFFFFFCSCNENFTSNKFN